MGDHLNRPLSWKFQAWT